MTYLPPTRDLRVRLDTAQALTRLFYREQAVVLACGRWIARTAPLELKAELGRTAWESALAADALRERVFELRYPTRFLDEQAEELPLESADDLRALLAELRDDYADYLDHVDELADGPSRRLVEAALRDKELCMFGRTLDWLVNRWQWPYAALFTAGFLAVLAPFVFRVAGVPLGLIYLQLPVYMLHQYEEHAGDRFRL